MFQSNSRIFWIDVVQDANVTNVAATDQLHRQEKSKYNDRHSPFGIQFESLYLQKSLIQYSPVLRS